MQLSIFVFPKLQFRVCVRRKSYFRLTAKHLSVLWWAQMDFLPIDCFAIKLASSLCAKHLSVLWWAQMDFFAN